MEIDKSTYNEYETELFAPIIKDSKGKYIAVLSDDSLDRDGERVGKVALQKLNNDTGYLAALMDHENKALNQVAKWVNRRVEKIGEHTALLAEAQFFKSNPNAVIIKGMLDEGAEFGVSIGAMVKQYEDTKSDGNTVRTFTELELLEASFCAIPSNKHGRAMAVAKSYDKTNKEKKMTEEVTFTQKEYDSKVEEVSKSFNEEKEEMSKTIESSKEEISKLSKSLEEAQKASDKKEEEDKKKKEEDDKKEEEGKKKLLDMEKELKETKEKSLEKQKFGEEGQDGESMSEEDTKKAIESGKIPFVKIQ